RDVGYGVVVANVFTTRQLSLQHAVETLHLFAVPMKRVTVVTLVAIGDVGDADEPAQLSGHGSETGHLPEQPGVDPTACNFVCGVEQAALASQVLKDRTGLEESDPLPAGGPVHQRRNPVVRAD